ncbi:MAG: type II toxin-antitoxin system VapC family toxin [Gemmatimonadetes bacterium]|nr:type II toxin-antitoxin system VapC family toxin [Gemmatimonadota bacterium]
MGEGSGLADRHGLSVHDAAYLELAHRMRLPLATLDRALASAALATGVETPATP